VAAPVTFTCSQVPISLHSWCQWPFCFTMIYSQHLGSSFFFAWSDFDATKKPINHKFCDACFVRSWPMKESCYICHCEGFPLNVWKHIFFFFFISLRVHWCMSYSNLLILINFLRICSIATCGVLSSLIYLSSRFSVPNVCWFVRLNLSIDDKDCFVDIFLSWLQWKFLLLRLMQADHIL
jgi:hypothetical protein